MILHKRRRFFWNLVVVSFLIVAAKSEAVFSQTDEEILETIPKGMSYNESLIKSAALDLTFEYYRQADMRPPDQVLEEAKEQVKKQGATPRQIEDVIKQLKKDLEERAKDPFMSGSSSKKGKARFLIKDNRIRLDVEYTQTIFKGPVDPRKEDEEKHSERPLKHTYYYSPTDSYMTSGKGGELIIEKEPQRPFIFPLKFGLKWSWFKSSGLRFFSNSLSGSLSKSKVVKEGKLELIGQEEVNGSMCYVLESFTPEHKLRVKYWIDPAKGYTVARDVVSSIGKQEGKEREFVMMERSCTVQQLPNGAWIPKTGVDKYYRLFNPYCKKIEDIKQYVEREERIEVTDCVLNEVTDEDVTVPDIDAGEYKTIIDMETGELIQITPPEAEEDTGEEVDVESKETEK